MNRCVIIFYKSYDLKTWAIMAFLHFLSFVTTFLRIFFFARQSLHTYSIGRIPCFTYLYYFLWVLHFPCFLPSWYLGFLLMQVSVPLYFIFSLKLPRHSDVLFMIFSKFVGRSTYLSLQISLCLFKSFHHQLNMDKR